MPLRNVSVRQISVYFDTGNDTDLFSNSANQNESTVRTLKLGMFLPTIISLVLRVLFRRSSLPPSKGSLAIYIVTFFPAFFLSNYLVKIGTTRRDPTTGTLISYGEDLHQPGVTEWCFDILYVTCPYLFTCLHVVGHLTT
jgi:multisubunit Na+/H+ antiporter MnhE subunit